MSKPYKHIAELYAHLMKFISYDEWAEYYMILAEEVPISTKVLELAAGNCKMAAYLKVKYPDMIASDLSIDMLKQCSQDDLLKVCCDMRDLPFKAKFGLIISAFDSVNYLMSKAALNDLFKGIKNLLTDDGIFTFDISLERNSLKNIKYLNRKGSLQGMKYIQKSEYDKKNRIHTNRFTLMFKDGSVVEEVHRQKIYPVEVYFEILEDNGLYVKQCYEAFTLDNVNRRSDRAQFIVSKRR